MVSLLLAKGADINALDGRGETPLCWTCSKSGLREYMEKHGASHDPNYLRIAKESDGGNSEANRLKFYEALDANEYAAVKCWVEKGVRPEATDALLDRYFDGTVSWHREASPSANMIRLLVKLGAKVNRGDEFKEPLVHIAVRECQHGYWDWRPAIRALVEAGADIDDKRYWDRTPLAAHATSNSELVRVLLELGADPDVQEGFLKEPLIFKTVFWGQVETAWLLVKSGADLSVRNKVGQRPLEYAEWLTYDRRQEALRASLKDIEERGTAEDRAREKEWFEKGRKVIVAILRGAER
jgi:hypothetical protein